MKELKDKEIMQLLTSPDETKKDEALRYLYRTLFKTVKAYILKRSGTEQDADDVFQDGLIAFYMMARQDKLPTDIKVEAYLFSICRNRWNKSIGRMPTKVELGEQQFAIPAEDQQLERILQAEKQELVARLLNQIGEECKKVLTYFYFDRLRIKQIKERLKYSSDQIVKNKKYNCMKKLRSIVQPYLKQS